MIERVLVAFFTYFSFIMLVVEMWPRYIAEPTFPGDFNHDGTVDAAGDAI